MFYRTGIQTPMNRILGLINPLLLVVALGNSLSGLAQALKTELAFQQELVVHVVGVVAAFMLTEVNLERAMLIVSILIILIVELLNSAIETAVDRIGPEQQPLSKRAKDLGSAAVLISVITAIVVWIIVLV